MEQILDRDGNVIQTSRNLAGIRRYVGTHLIKKLDVCQIGQWEGQLSILFDDGASYQTNFASFAVLFDFVRRWRNVYGAPFSVNGKDVGVVSKDITRHDCGILTTPRI